MRPIFMISLILLISAVLVFADSPLDGKKIVIVIAEENFRDEELFIPRKVLLDNGASVIIASTKLDEAKGMMGKSVKPDILIESIIESDFDGIIFVGGIGAKDLWDNADAQNIAKKFNSEKKPIGAICLAPVILAKAGILEHRPATVFKSAADIIEENGAIYAEKPVMISNNIVTADGPESADEFIRHYVGLLIPAPSIIPVD